MKNQLFQQIIHLFSSTDVLMAIAFKFVYAWIVVIIAILLFLISR